MPVDGYPTKAELKRLKHFHGTLPEFFDYAESLWVNGAGVKREYVPSNIFSGNEHVITFVTGGWSGCEETMGVITKTFASLLTHSKWERGGLFEFRITDNYWNFPPMHWGYPKYMPKEEAK